MDRMEYQNHLAAKKFKKDFNLEPCVGMDLVNFEKKNGSDRPFDVVSPPWLYIFRSERNVGTGQSHRPNWI
jgi:hypothetical protein